MNLIEDLVDAFLMSEHHRRRRTIWLVTVAAITHTLYAVLVMYGILHMN